MLFTSYNTPSQVAAYIFIMPKFLQRQSTRALFRAFVKLFPNCSLVLTYSMEIKPCCIFWRIKWLSISMCLFCSWKIRLFTIWKVVSLSYYNFAGTKTLKPTSIKSWYIHIISHTDYAMALYSILHSIKTQHFAIYFSMKPNCL